MIAIRWGGARQVAGIWFWGGMREFRLPKSDKRYGCWVYERRFFWKWQSAFHPFAPHIVVIGIGPIIVTINRGKYGSRRTQ